MAKCAQCQKTILLSEVKAGDTRYCGEACADAALLPAFTAAVEAPAPATTVIPRRSAARVGPDDSMLVDREGTKPGLAIAIGVLVAVALSVAMHFIEASIDWQLRGLNFAVILPIGAVLCGAIISLGFFGAARLLDTRPRVSTYIAAIATAGLLCWLTYAIAYLTMTDETGTPVREVIGFGGFMQFVVEDSTIQLGRTRTSAVTAGKWGYALFASDWIGFMIGAWGALRLAAMRPFCEGCGRFMSKAGRLARSGNDPAAAGTAVNAMVAHMGANNPQRAVDALKAFGEPNEKSFFAIALECHACPMCKDYTATVTTTLAGRKARRELHAETFAGNGDVQLG